MSEQGSEITGTPGTKPEEFAPGGPDVVATRAPESLGGGLQEGGQQVGGSKSPAGDLTEEDDLFTDDGKEGE